MRLKRTVTVVAGAVLTAVLVTACNPPAEDGSAQSAESKTQQSGYEYLSKAQPARSMQYSPTRDTINAWVETWGKKGQLAFTYILNQNGDKIGYYVFQGPPVSYCASLTPTYRWADPGGSDNNGDITVPAPSLDGVYYSGGQCSDYYGKDATTGNLIEFTTGTSLNFITATQPLYLDVPALGQTTINEVRKNADGEYVK